MAVNLTSFMDEGQLRPLGIRTVGEWVECAWLSDMRIQPVVELKYPLFSGPQARQPRLLAARGASWRSAWYRGMHEIRSELDNLLKTRSLPVVDALLPELSWFFARKLTGSTGWRENEIDLDRIRSVADGVGRDGILLLGKRRLHSIDIHQKILPYITQVGAGIARAPWPQPDRYVSNVFECFDADTVVERTRLVYEAALNAYVQIAKTWFGGLWPDLELAQKLPAEFCGIVSFQDSKEGQLPILTYSWEPNASEQLVSVNLSFGDTADVGAFVSKREARHGWGQTILSDVLSDYPATELAYRWVIEDLRALAWLK